MAPVTHVSGSRDPGACSSRVLKTKIRRICPLPYRPERVEKRDEFLRILTTLKQQRDAQKLLVVQNTHTAI